MEELSLTLGLLPGLDLVNPLTMPLFSLAIPRVYDGSSLRLQIPGTGNIPSFSWQ